MSLVCNCDEAFKRVLAWAVHLTEPTRRQAVWWMLLLLSLGFLIRCHRISEPPVLKSTRPYIGALLSRHYYFEMSDDIPQWRRDRARESVEREGIMEPPLLPIVTATAFKLTGGERRTTARLIVIAGWMLGTFALYRLGRCWHSRTASFAGVALLLLMPFGIALSAATQPDGWMVAMTIVAWWRLVRAFRTGRLTAALGAGLAAGAAVLIKPTCLFVIAGAMATLLLKGDRDERRRISPSTLTALALPAILVLALYYLPGIFGGTRLNSQVHISFDPGLWVTPGYYLNWLQTIGSTIGYIAASCMIVVLTWGPSTGASRFQIGLWAGYLVYGLVFNHHVSTHDYYSLILIPMTALATASAVGLLQQMRPSKAALRKSIILAASLTMAALVVELLASGRTIPNPKDLARITGRLAGVNEAFLIYASQTYVRPKERVKVLQEIGEKVGHSGRCIVLARDYGKSLFYHGEISGWFWPLHGDPEMSHQPGYQSGNSAGRLEDLVANAGAEYFICTFPEELTAQAGLRDLLDRRSTRVTTTDSYIIYRLQPAATP